MALNDNWKDKKNGDYIAVEDINSMAGAIIKNEFKIAEFDEEGIKVPYIGINGNWYLWNSKSKQYIDSGINSKGEKGDDGKGIERMAYYDTTSDGQVGIYVWYSDGTTDTLWIPGLKGENGVGIESIEMLPMGDECSNIIVKLTDGTENSFPVYNGKDAYQVATQNGFEGSEEEWLASLKGEKGDSLTLTVTDDGNGNVKLTIE